MKNTTKKHLIWMALGPWLFSVSCMKSSLSAVEYSEPTKAPKAASTATDLEEIPVPAEKPPSSSEEQSETVENKNDKDEKSVEPTEEPKKDVKAESSPAADMTGPGRLKPTVYFFVTLNEDNSKCEKEITLHGQGGKELIKVCKETEKACGLQGSCAVVQNGTTRAFNVIGRFEGQDRYFEIQKDGCRFGYGVQSSCLDPFYTLAADMDIYKPGDVIFVPAVVGTVLPDGSKHSGYFVIRDQGRGIKGAGRFDFFSGPISWSNPQNPFSKLGLSDVGTNIPYYRVGGRTAKRVLRHRAFPQLPPKVAVTQTVK